MDRSAESRQKWFVCLLESHPLAASHLTAALTRNRKIEVITTGIDLISEAVSKDKYSVLIIDANTLPFPLLPYLLTLRKVAAKVKILVVGKRISDDELCELLFHGVRGFVTYEQVEDEIGRAVDAVLSGHVWAPPGVLERYVPLSACLASSNHCEHGALSPRESEVIGLLEQRLSNKEIGSALGITERTVRFHLQNIFDKIGTRDRYSVVEWARAGGLEARPDMESNDQPSQEGQPLGSQALRNVA